MDNVTHSLVGLLLAEGALVVRARRESAILERSGWRAGAYFVSLLANNLPDFDFVYTSLTGGKLGYLLHHRGHTHTLVAVLPLALLAVGIVGGWVKWRRLDWSRGDWLWLTALAVIGPLLHIAMDLSNNYGVHPFWPIHNGWLYGDCLFIVEPLLWVVTIPPLLYAVRAWLSKATLMLLALFIAGACWFVPFVGATAATVVTLGPLVLVFALRRATPLGRVSIGVGLSLAVSGLFVVTRQLVERAVKPAFEQTRSVRLLELAFTPAPANPFCFELIAIELSDKNYVLRQAVAAPIPGFISAHQCPVWNRGSTLPLQAELSPSAAIAHVRSWRTPHAELVSVYEQHCEAAAFFRFARAPFVLRSDKRTKFVVGDLRYDRQRELDFAEIELDQSRPNCPEFVPPWLPPRLDALTSDQKPLAF